MPSEHTVANSRCTMTEIVLPNDTNGLGNMMGGRLLHLMDKCAAISAQRHARRVCVTASVDNVEFQRPIREGNVVVVESQVNRAFRTSMEVELNVWVENPRDGTHRKCNRAFYTFVALSEDGHPIKVPQVVPETEEQKERFKAAGKRRDVRLVVAGRLSLDEANHLQADMVEAVRAAQNDD